MTQIKLFLVLGALILGQLALHRNSIKSKDEEIDRLTTRVEQHVTTIESQKLELADLDKYKRMTEGLQKIVDYQRQQYEEFSKEVETKIDGYMGVIQSMTEEDIKAGNEIDHAWDMYREIEK